MTDEEKERRRSQSEPKADLDLVVMAVTGYVSYDVRADCPHCMKRLCLNQYPYTDEASEYALPEDELGLALFGMKNEPAKWEGLDIKYQCCGCKGKFSLGRMEP